MPRALRIEYPGAIYYLTNRNDSGAAIFRDSEDYLRFLFALGETCAKLDWQVHAFVLDPGRFRLVVETPGANLVAGMYRFLRAYTTHYQRRHGLTGELFVQRYKSKLVDGHGIGWLGTISDYVHVHPARAGLLQPAQALRDYAWSSLPLYLNSPANRPDWLRVNRVFAQHGIAGDDDGARTELECHLEQCRLPRNQWVFRGIERGWYYGGYHFQRDLLERQLIRANGKEPSGTRPEPGVEKARRIVQEELDKLCLTPADLPRHAKADARKIRIAQRLRAETAVTLKWIARELHMGTPDYLAHRLHHANKKSHAMSGFAMVR
jgi:putative transposase